MKRRQFSLRSILLVVTLIAVCLGLWEALVYSESKARQNRVRAWKTILAKLDGEKAILENEIQTGDLSTQSRSAWQLEENGQFIERTKQMIAAQSD